MSTAAQQLKWMTLVVTLWAVMNTASGSDIIDLVCSSEADCSNFRGMDINSTCVDGTCKCFQEPSGNKTTCFPFSMHVTILMGGQCPCDSENSYCNEKTQMCVCKDGFLPSRERKKCLNKLVPLGKACEIDEQCIMQDYFSHCDDKHRNCTCQNHFAEFEGTCHSVIAAPNATADSCEKDADCAKLTANATCHEKQCLCGKGFVGDAAASNCLAVGRYEGNCTDSNQCIATLGIGSVCYETKCVCSDSFFPFQDHVARWDGTTHDIRTICKRKVLYGATCNNDKECYQFHRGPHEQTMECDHSECVCAHGFTEKDGICVLEDGSGATFHRVPFWITLFVAVLAFLSRKCLC